jgi:hypothetical protein
LQRPKSPDSVYNAQAVQGTKNWPPTFEKTTSASLVASSTGAQGLLQPDYDYEETMRNMPTTRPSDLVPFSQPPSIYLHVQPGLVLNSNQNSNKSTNFRLTSV